MSAWFTAIKALLPHIGTIVSAAAPAFTRKTGEAAPLVQQQIAELQNAAAQNTAYIKELAEQLRNAIAALEQAALINEKRLRRAYTLAAIAAVAALAAIAVALFAR